MKLFSSKLSCLIVVAAGLIVCGPFASSKIFAVSAQNRISGIVFGAQRHPMSDLNVELQDDVYRTIGRTRTNGAGRYEFSGMNTGQFLIRVYTFGTDYEEQERSVEITQLTRNGWDFQTADFFLRLRKGVAPEAAAGVIFAQDVPAEAKKLYDKALKDLDSKRTADALTELKQAIEIFPKYYYALERLATEYARMGKPETYQAAEILFALAVDVNARGFKSWYGLAHARYSLGKYPDAMLAVQKALELNANAPDAVFLSGVLMKRSQKYIEAEKQLIKARDLSKDTIPAVHRELADLYANHLDRYGDAAKELKLFLKAQPDNKDSDTIKKMIAELEAKAKKT